MPIAPQIIGKRGPVLDPMIAAGHVGNDERAHEGQIRKAGAQGRVAARLLEVEAEDKKYSVKGQVHKGAEDDCGTEIRQVKYFKREHGLAGFCLREIKRGCRGHREDGAAEDERMTDSQRASFNHGASQAADGQNRERLPERVEVMRRLRVSIGRNRAQGQVNADGAEREVDQKNASPSQAGNQQPAGDGARGDRHASARGPKAHGAGAEAVIAGGCVIEQRQRTGN